MGQHHRCHLPLSVGYAILRYQLFDIRVVVRKGFRVVGA